jgi:hypothetical protein
MSFEIPGQLITLPASADLSASQFRAMVTSSGQLAVAGAGVDIVGVLQDKPDAAGREGAIMVDGVSKMVAGAAVTQDAAVMSDATGRAIDATATNKGIGIALQAASAAGEIIAVLLKDLGTQ